jgi:hypothetical protein
MERSEGDGRVATAVNGGGGREEVGEDGAAWARESGAWKAGRAVSGNGGAERAIYSWFRGDLEKR